MDTIFVVLRNTLYGLLILLTGFLIIKGVVDWEKLFDILK